MSRKFCDLAAVGHIIHNWLFSFCFHLLPHYRTVLRLNLHEFFRKPEGLPTALDLRGLKTDFYSFLLRNLDRAHVEHDVASLKGVLDFVFESVNPAPSAPCLGYNLVNLVPNPVWWRFPIMRPRSGCGNTQHTNMVLLSLRLTGLPELQPAGRASSAPALSGPTDCILRTETLKLWVVGYLLSSVTKKNPKFTFLGGATFRSEVNKPVYHWW